MRLGRDTLRRLVLLNTALLIMIIGGLVLGAAFALKSNRVRAALRAVIDRETSQSDTVAAITGARAAAPLEHWQLQIDADHMRRMEELAKSLRASQALTSSDRRWFPAELQVDGERYAGKVRLRGDLDRHWRGAKKSLRLRLDRERLFRGMREIDLILPNDKGYEVEPLVYEVGRELDLITPPAGFVVVTLNAVDMGAYFWREVPGKEALEKLGWPEGELFVERNTWIQEYFSGRGIYRIPSPPISFHPANWKAEVHDEAPHAGRFVQRWQRFLSLIIGAEDAAFDHEIPLMLDIDRYLSWNALTWLFGSTHSHWGDNLNWYYDPTTGRFQPLLYDVFRYRLENEKLGTFEAHEHDDLALRLLARPSYRLRRNEVLWRLVTDDRFDMGARAADAFRAIAPHLVRGVEAPTRREVEAFENETQAILAENRQQIRDHLAFGRLFVAPTLTVEDGVATLTADLAPDALVPITLLGLDLALDGPAGPVRAWQATATIEDAAGNRRQLVAASRVEDSSVSLDLAGAVLDTPVDERLVPRLGRYRLQLVFEALDPSAWRRPGRVTAVSWRTRHALTDEPIAPSHLFAAAPAYDVEPARPAAAAGDGIDDRPAGERALTRARAAGWPARLDGASLVLPTGRHALSRDLILPQGIGLRLEAGVHLAMGPGVSLLVRGPLAIDGTATAPVIVGPAGEMPWGALGVVAPGAASRLRHLVVRGGSEAWVEGIYLSGQLSLYDAAVDLERVVIMNGRADDGLNVKRGAVRIHASTFAGNAFDGFDGDFVEGSLTDTCFLDNGGDGVDLSGAELTVARSLFSGMGDKALSVGERSTVTVRDSVVRRSLIGLAVKDQSEVETDASVFDGNGTAFALFEKKPIFGGGRATISSTLVWDNERDIEIDGKSRLVLNTVGLAERPTAPGVVIEDLRIGDPASAYEREGQAGYRFVGGSDSPFTLDPASDGGTRIGLTELQESVPCPAVPGSS